MDLLPSLLTGATAITIVGLESIVPIRARSFAERLGHASPHAVLMVLNLALTAATATLLRRVEAASGWHGPLAALGEVAPAVAILLGLLALDLRKYAIHRAKHAFAPLWALHRSHHNDTEMDFTTRFRFHPGETLVDELSGFVVAAALGVGADTFLLYRALLYPSALIVHANVRFPAWFDAALRPVFISPELHHVHHSLDPLEEHSNFGDLLSVWDRLFGTLRRNADWYRIRTGVAGDEDRRSALDVPGWARGSGGDRRAYRSGAPRSLRLVRAGGAGLFVFADIEPEAPRVLLQARAGLLLI